MFGLKFCKISGDLAVIGVFVVNSHGFGWRTTTMEGQTMPGIVEFPQLVPRAVEGCCDHLISQLAIS